VLDRTDGQTDARTSPIRALALRSATLERTRRGSGSQATPKEIPFDRLIDERIDGTRLDPDVEAEEGNASNGTGSLY